MEYALNAFNIVSQMVVSATYALQDALSRAVVSVTEPLQRLGPSVWPRIDATADSQTFIVVGLLILVVASFAVRRS